MKHVPKFRKTFKIDSKADLTEVAVAVNAIYEADKIAMAYLGNIEPKDGSDGFRIHSLLNLLGRIFDACAGNARRRVNWISCERGGARANSCRRFDERHVPRSVG